MKKYSKKVWMKQSTQKSEYLNLFHSVNFQRIGPTLFVAVTLSVIDARRYASQH